MDNIPVAGFHQPETRPRAGGGYKLSPGLKFVKKKVLPALLSHPFAGPFRSPVNAKAEGIYPDYFKVVTIPMDLRTVKSRLDHGWYWDTADCIADINQVWNNAKLYNPAPHMIHQWALAMSSVTVAWLQRMPEPPSTSSAKEVNRFNLRVCENILDTLMTDSSMLDKCSSPFLVISARYARDTYTPVDLSTLRTRLKAGQYESAEQFAEDFRLMINETYRFCIDKDPIIEQARELHHQFEMAFAKRTKQGDMKEQKRQHDQKGKKREEDQVRQGGHRRQGDPRRQGGPRRQEEPRRDQREHMVVEDEEMNRLQNILAMGHAMQEKMDRMVDWELKLEERRRFEDARMLVKEIEEVGPEVMGEVVDIIRANKEPMDIESDGTVAVSYDSLSSSTISQVRRVIRARREGGVC